MMVVRDLKGANLIEINMNKIELNLYESVISNARKSFLFLCGLHFIQKKKLLLCHFEVKKLKVEVKKAH